MSPRSGADNYLWPGRDVLRNRLGILDRTVLRKVEYAQIAFRGREIENEVSAIKPTHDEAHLRAIHQHLFQDIYDWAGQLRTIALRKSFTDFAPVDQISHCLEQAALAGGALRGSNAVTRQQFVAAISEVFAWANFAHPFREGNGRATRVWLSSIADATPWALDFGRADAAVWNQRAEFSSPDRGALTPYPRELHELFAHLTVPARP